MGRERDHDLVEYRYLGHVSGGDGAGVVGEPIPGDAAERALGPVKAGDQRLQAAVADRDHHPETRPGQPAAEEIALVAVNPGTVGPVELGPHPRFGDPGSKNAAIALAVALLGPGYGSADGAFRTGKAERFEPAPADFGPDLAPRAQNPLFDLGPKGVDDGGTRYWGALTELTLVALVDVDGDGVVRAVAQATGGAVGPGQVERFKNLHDFLVKLHLRLLPGDAGLARTS